METAAQAPTVQPDNGLSEQVFLAVGLRIARYGTKKKFSMRTQMRRFREMYGCNPVVVQAVWYDSQSTRARENEA